MSNNWYKRITVADASTGGYPGPGDDFHPYQGTPLVDKDDDIVFMERKVVKPVKIGPAFERDEINDQTRKNDVVRIPFKKDDIVYRREGSWANKKQKGRITVVTDNSIHVQWDGNKEPERIPLNETVYLAQQIQVT